MSNPFLRKTVDEIRDTWQSRALAASSDKRARVLVGAFAKEYAAALPILLRASIKDFEDIQTPFLSGYAVIMQSGRMVADMTDSAGDVRKVAVYHSESEFLMDMRMLADELKLNDADRTEMFAVLRRWVVADYRMDMNGRKIAS